MPGAGCARSLACSVENTRVSHHGHTGVTRHSLRNGFNGFLRALPGDRAFLPPSPVRCASIVTRLNASVEASGPHDFAVRITRLRQKGFAGQGRRSSFGAFASTASRPTFVTMANAPLSGGMARSCRSDLPVGLSEIFLQRGLDTHATDLPVGQIISRPIRSNAEKRKPPPLSIVKTETTGISMSQVGANRTNGNRPAMSVDRGRSEVKDRRSNRRD
jgi:hypothetical protein